MRISTVVLILLFTARLWAVPLCGVYHVQAYIPEKSQGLEAYVNPDMVTSTKFILKNVVPKEYWGRVIKLEVTFKKVCLLSCEISEYKILEAVSPFEKLKAFNHDQEGLIKKMDCERFL